MVARSSIIGSTSLFQFSASECAAELNVLSFTGQEAVSNLFEVQLELACEDNSLSLPKLVGSDALLTIDGEAAPRYFQGMISRFEQVDELPRHALYHATLVPLVWRMKLRHDCRIFQALRTPEIIKNVLSCAGVSSTYFEFRLSGTYEPRDYCVQYRESDWAFLSRLMEEDGIFYFFEHHEDRHVLVIGDSMGSYRNISGVPSLPFRPASRLVTHEEHVERFRFAEELQPAGVRLRDFNFKKPSLPMEVRQCTGGNSDLQVYDYPGEYQDPTRGSPGRGLTMAGIRLEEWQARRSVGQGTSDCERFSPGRLFTLAEHPCSDFNERYLLTSVRHEGRQPQALHEAARVGELRYDNAFTCIRMEVPFRPPRVTPRPLMRGVQTATVTGPASEEIHTDEFGRVKVQFHWDREGQYNEQSSCWVRISQLWAGEGWGAMYIPRIGQEVLVDFIEGDPDRPIITGRVYNGLNPTPYALPEHKSRSTIKSNTTPGGEGYNELRFEDRKGAEQIFLHAQRDMDVHVKHDSRENILRDRHQTIGSESSPEGKVGDQTELVYRDRNLTVHRHDTAHIGGDMKLRVGGIDGPGNQDIIIEADKKEHIGGASHLHVVGDRNELVDGSWSITVGGDVQAKVKGAYALDVAPEIHLKSAKIVLEASSGLTIKGPGGFVTIDAAGIAISGTMVKINSGGSALSGSGASPVAPTEPAQAQPPAPILADDGRVP